MTTNNGLEKNDGKIAVPWKILRNLISDLKEQRKSNCEGRIIKADSLYVNCRKKTAIIKTQLVRNIINYQYNNPHKKKKQLISNPRQNSYNSIINIINHDGILFRLIQTSFLCLFSEMERSSIPKIPIQAALPSPIKGATEGNGFSTHKRLDFRENISTNTSQTQVSGWKVFCSCPLLSIQCIWCTTTVYTEYANLK